MDHSAIQQAIAAGKTSLGIELGSTRIKAVLIDQNHAPIASGSHGWENKYENGIWTYGLDEVWTGLQDCYRALAADVQEKYGVALAAVGSIGISGMMHGYLALNQHGELLAPFRTWRNTTTEQAAAQLTGLFQFNIPQRWSIAHLDQAILNNEAHVKDIAFLTTLAGYVHWKLTGQKVVGIGEASGIFPIDSQANDYNAAMVQQFNQRIAARGFPWKLQDILPKVLTAGDSAGSLTEEGAKLVDPSGQLKAGIPACPPEGDAGTGMIATNSIAVRTGNVSAGTSVFAMIVLEKDLSKVYPEIDMVTTPAGKPVAMVHSNTCTSDIDAWAGLFREAAEALGVKVDPATLYNTLYLKALEGDTDCGGLLAYNYLAGEPVTGFEEGRPLFARMPDSRFTLANFMRTLLFSALGTLKIGMDILFDQEQVKIDKLLGHGGFYKTKGVGQKLTAAALNTPVAVMETAGEGGAWGMALLAAYSLRKQPGESLVDYLENKVFAGEQGSIAAPDPRDLQSFTAFLGRYKKGLTIERAAVTAMR